MEMRRRLSAAVGTGVPPVSYRRDRREDLTLLIQTFINRFCHESGKRMQGITVKAMSALLAYDYPGNLAELENIASLPGGAPHPPGWPARVERRADGTSLHCCRSPGYSRG